LKNGKDKLQIETVKVEPHDVYYLGGFVHTRPTKNVETHNKNRLGPCDAS